MKNKFFLAAIMMIMAVVCAKAQDTQLVTVQHGTEMKAFYGTDAFKEAIVAAQEGDVISLSGGNYNSATIDKAVTIQGAGYVDDQMNNRFRTHFVGDMTINLPEGAKGLYIEGISTFDNVTVEGYVESMYFGCCLMTKSMTVNSESKRLSFLHCRINTLSMTGVAHSALIRNCCIEGFGGSNSSEEDGVVENCVINYCADNVIRFTFKNSIMYRANNYISHPAISSSVLNSYFHNLINTFNRGLGNCVSEGNTTVRYSNYYDMLHIYFGDGSVNYLSKLDLTEEGKKILGTDGTEIGIHGGSMPFTDIPSTPQITQKSVAPQSDANGKLAVKFVIEAQN